MSHLSSRLKEKQRMRKKRDDKVGARCVGIVLDNSEIKWTYKENIDLNLSNFILKLDHSF